MIVRKASQRCTWEKRTKESESARIYSMTKKCLRHEMLYIVCIEGAMGRRLELELEGNEYMEKEEEGGRNGNGMGKT